MAVTFIGTVTTATYDSSIHDFSGFWMGLPTFEDRPTGGGALSSYTSNGGVQVYKYPSGPPLAKTVIITFRLGQHRIYPRNDASPEYRYRQILAQYGFKPSRIQQYGQAQLKFSRSADLDGTIPSVWTQPGSIASWIVPFVVHGFTATGGAPGAAVTLDLSSLTCVSSGQFFQTYPWPRVLNAFRVYNTSTGTQTWPRPINDVGTGNRPRYEWLGEDGDMTFYRARDPVVTPANNKIRVRVGESYQIQIGHVRPFPRVSKLGGNLGAGEQRWPNETL